MQLHLCEGNMIRFHSHGNYDTAEIMSFDLHVFKFDFVMCVYHKHIATIFSLNFSVRLMYVYS